jgi:fructose-bisphosphate aldolase, class I
METQSIHTIAKRLVEAPKGLLAADESMPTIEKRFVALGIESTEATRQSYREMLFTTPDIEKYLSGVILFEETLICDEGKLPKLLQSKGIIPGIKVDQGTEGLPGSTTEKITKGLAGLADRLKTYKEAGAQFTKWRAVITISEGIPTERCISENAKLLAQYAKVVQDNGMVPIVEPEVLMDGSHSMEVCAQVTYKTLKTVFQQIESEKVDLKGMILKPNMIVPGKDSGMTASPDEVSHATLTCLRSVVPHEVPGIMFLSGGQTSESAIANLAKMNENKDLPWRLSFSYARALQSPAMEAWGGKSENVASAQATFVELCRKASEASVGGKSE